jgi:hypothetical protein
MLNINIVHIPNKPEIRYNWGYLAGSYDIDESNSNNCNERNVNIVHSSQNKKVSTNSGKNTDTNHFPMYSKCSNNCVTKTSSDYDKYINNDDANVTNHTIDTTNTTNTMDTMDRMDRMETINTMNTKDTMDMIIHDMQLFTIGNYNKIQTDELVRSSKCRLINTNDADTILSKRIPVHNCECGYFTKKEYTKNKSRRKTIHNSRKNNKIRNSISCKNNKKKRYSVFHEIKRKRINHLDVLHKILYNSVNSNKTNVIRDEMVSTYTITCL